MISAEAPSNAGPACKASVAGKLCWQAHICLCNTDMTLWSCDVIPSDLGLFKGGGFVGPVSEIRSPSSTYNLNAFRTQHDASLELRRRSQVDFIPVPSRAQSGDKDPALLLTFIQANVHVDLIYYTSVAAAVRVCSSWSTLLLDL
jgi:hypothetical protein